METHVLVLWEGGESGFPCENTENAVFKEVGKLIPSVPMPNEVTVEASCSSGKTVIEVTEVQDGITSMNGRTKIQLKVLENTLNLVPRISEYKPYYLTCVDPRRNHKGKYDYFECRGLKRGGLDIVFGRIEMSIQHPFYRVDTCLYWPLYYARLAKGYVDRSEVRYSASAYDADKALPIPSKALPEDRSLFSYLLKIARQHILETVDVPEHSEITQAQIEDAKESLSRLEKSETYAAFNREQENFCVLVPRKVKSLLDLYVDPDDEDPAEKMAGLLQDDRDLLDQMEFITKAKETDAKGFADLGVDIEDAGKEGLDVVKSLMNDHWSKPYISKIVRVYNVHPRKQEEKFAAYCKERGIEGSGIQELFHGSPSENMASIIINSLMLHPDAAICGKMLGNGIYTANVADKSLGYAGGRWRSDMTDRNFLCVFRCAVGNELPVHGSNGYTLRHYTKKELDDGGYDCVHAYADAGLYRDEIVFFDESALVIDKLIELHF